MHWNFAIINKRLGEVFWEERNKKRKILGHTYVERSEYKTKREQRMIDKDIANCRLVYRNKKYRRILPT